MAKANEEGCKHGYTHPCSLCQEEARVEALERRVELAEGRAARAELERDILAAFAREAVKLDAWLLKIPTGKTLDPFVIPNDVYTPFVTAMGRAQDADLLAAPPKEAPKEPKNPWETKVPPVEQLSKDLHDPAQIHETLAHAEYWRNGAKAATTREEQWHAHDQAVNSWKNLAFSLSCDLKQREKPSMGLPTWLEDGKKLIESKEPGVTQAWDEWWKRHGTDTLKLALVGYAARARRGADETWDLPAEPPLGLLISMAIRYDHGLGVPGYYDQPMFGEEGSHAARFASTVATMRQIYEEVSGQGFYHPKHEESYAASAPEALREDHERRREMRAARPS